MSKLLPGSPSFCRRCGNIPHYRAVSGEHYKLNRKWLCVYCTPDADHAVPEQEQFSPAETMSNWGGVWSPRKPTGPAKEAKRIGAKGLLEAYHPLPRIGLFGLNGVCTCATEGCELAVSMNRYLLCQHQGIDKTCLGCALLKRVQAEQRKEALKQ